MSDFDLMIQDSFFYHDNSLTSKVKNASLDIIKKITKLFPASSEIRLLSKEIELLSNYSTDTIYRLRYDTMTYEYVSPSVIKLLGFTASELQNMNLRSLILETRMINDGMKKVLDYYELERNRKNRNVTKWQADYLMRTKDGRKLWVSDVSYPWIDKDGKIIGSIGSLRDINDRVNSESQVREQLARLALSDPLTGLANRREFFRRTDLELKRLQRSPGEMSILLIDIDHFKYINDKFGHDAGDHVLSEIGKILDTCLRDTDLAARIGGEEFSILLTDTNARGAYWVAERICNKISRHQFTSTKLGKMNIKCTVSIGISSVDLDATLDSRELYRLADDRLYIAKNTGRNQVSVDEVLKVH
ncbi:MAG: sensor domain-containing diguanylate cyclase [Rickettsiales bacterium]|nr:sensor domain-containing diguanylate cyclase [Rickettsiales bacterium]